MWFIIFLVAFPISELTKRELFCKKRKISKPLQSPVPIFYSFPPHRGHFDLYTFVILVIGGSLLDEWYTALYEVSLKLNLHIQVKEFVHIHRHCNVNLAAAFAAEQPN